MQQIQQATCACVICNILKWRQSIFKTDFVLDFWKLFPGVSGLCPGLSVGDDSDGNFPARNQYCIICFDMRHFIRSHERNRRHSLKTADEQRRSSLTNSNDSHLFRKSSLPARAFANNSTTSNVNGACRRFRRFNTISDDINPVTLSLVVCSIAFFIVAALFYSLYWRK